ncbi:MAG: DUF433 domain-containing protein [Actinomycetota bacterium]
MASLGPLRGSYSAERAAGLAGVPLSTLYYWANHSIMGPSVSDVKPRLWSYTDILALRLVDWLRSDKSDARFPKASMGRIRGLLSSFDDLGRELEEGLNVWVDGAGIPVVSVGEGMAVPIGKKLLQGRMDAPALNLLLPYGSTRPDLRKPRPTLRMLPGKLSGQPHVQGTRVETAAIAALASRGLTTANIIELYRALVPTNVEEALELEAQISSVA